MFGENYFWAEFFLQRGIGLIYLIAFLVISRQYLTLVGEKGLKPIGKYVNDKSFLDCPSLFYFLNKDVYLRFFSYVCVFLGFLGLFPWISCNALLI